MVHKHQATRFKSIAYNIANAHQKLFSARIHSYSPPQHICSNSFECLNLRSCYMFDLCQDTSLSVQVQSTCDCSGMTAASRASVQPVTLYMPSCKMVCWNVVIRDNAALQGEHAHRVWNAIYSQQCFNDLNDTDTCQEQRIFYRLISGEPWHHCHAMLTPGQLMLSPHIINFGLLFCY